MRASSELQFGALREVAVRERQGALSRRAWQRSIGWVRTRFGEGGGQLDRRRVRVVLNPCARESRARTGRFLREKLISDHGLFSSYEGLQGAANGQDSWDFSRMHRALDGWMLARAPASPAQGLQRHGPHYFNFPSVLIMFGLEKLVYQNQLERDLSALLLRTLVVVRRQQFESIEVALDLD